MGGESVGEVEQRNDMSLCWKWDYKNVRTPVKIADNNQNVKRFLYSKPDFDGLAKILAVFDG